jgi:fatty acyl-CoA reductase
MHLEKLDGNKLVVDDIAGYYANKSILITGATGYLGKVLAEKLLRSCSDLKKIYLLIRHKKGKKPSERLDEIINSKLFDEVKRLGLNYKEKLEIVEGDLTLPKLGLSDENREKIIENVNIIFNSAATIRFDEPLE